MNLSHQDKEGLALRLRLKFELGLISKDEIQKEASSWSPEVRNEMRGLYRDSVKSVVRRGASK
jgi:hypothetical protein